MIKALRALVFSMLFLILITSCHTKTGNPSDDTSQISAPDTLSLDDLHRRTFDYFWELADPQSGLIPDRWPTKTFSSIAAQGFGLTAYIIGIEHNYVSRREAADRVLKTLEFLWNLPQGDAAAGTAGFHGFFYHFLDMQKGTRYQEVELSTIDTGLLMAGILACMTYFDGRNDEEYRIRDLADKLYQRVEWDWFLNDNGLLSMGWHPGKGFLKAQWSGYNEAMILNILALGSPTHPVPASLWDKWTQTYVWEEFQGYEQVNFGPLFGHQYSHLFIDFRAIKDDYMRKKGIDYFINSHRATLSNRAYCIENPSGFRGYGENIWGLTACDGPAYAKLIVDDQKVQFYTYRARGAAANYLVDDGTIAPTAAGGSVAFAPDVCIAALQTMYHQYGDKIYGKYGFLDAFNLTFITDETPEGWFDKDYIGIDEGPVLIMLENYRSELIWNLMKMNPYIVAGLKKAGFKGGWLAKAENE